MLGKSVLAVNVAALCLLCTSLSGFSVFLGAVGSAPSLPTLAVFLSWFSLIFYQSCKGDRKEGSHLETGPGRLLIHIARGPGP